MSQSQSEFSEILELLVDFVGYVHLLTPLFYYGPGQTPTDTAKCSQEYCRGWFQFPSNQTKKLHHHVNAVVSAVSTREPPIKSFPT